MAMVGVKAPARCVAAHEGDKDRVRFLAGSNALRDENEIQLVEHDPATGAASAVATFAHGAGEIWDLAPCPEDPEALVTVHNAGTEGYKATLWRTPPGCTSGALTCASELQGQKGVIKRATWHPKAGQSQLLTVGEDGFRIWNADGAAATCSGSVSAGELEEMYTGCWDPHDASTLCTAAGTGVAVWDARVAGAEGGGGGQPSLRVDVAHAMRVRDVHYNTRIANHVVTAGDDCKIRFWDLRAPAAPLLELAGHSHWVWAARYNPHHDQLVLSASSDSLVNLWKCPSVSSSAGDNLQPTPMTTPSIREPADVVALRVDDHDDSVYSVAWSAVDPFMFASLSYSGRLVLTQVPRNVKYQVLL